MAATEIKAFKDCDVGSKVLYAGPQTEFADFDLLRNGYYEITSKNPPTFVSYPYGDNDLQLPLDHFPQGENTEFQVIVNVNVPGTANNNQGVGFAPNSHRSRKSRARKTRARKTRARKSRARRSTRKH